MSISVKGVSTYEEILFFSCCYTESYINDHQKLIHIRFAKIYFLIFSLWTQLLIIVKSSINSVLEVLLSWIARNKFVFWVNDLVFEERPFVKSVILMRNSYPHTCPREGMPCATLCFRVSKKCYHRAKPC